MKAVGLIAEYNPFHNGHEFHLKQSKQLSKNSHVVVVMSGNFVQRGEPAIVDKQCRTKMALLAGADVVIELPVCYATASAEYFAEGAIKILQATGVVNHVCFGSESGEIEPLAQLAMFFLEESEPYKRGLTAALSTGVGFVQARQNAIETTGMGQYSELIRSPNNILAVAYLKALAKHRCDITPLTIKREGAAYHDVELKQTMPSATALRQAIFNLEWPSGLANERDAMPPDCFDLLNNEMTAGFGVACLNNFSQLLHYSIKGKDLQWLKSIQDVTEGLENRITQSIGLAYDIKDIIPQIKSKRYTFTKIQRCLLHCLLAMTKEDFERVEQAGGPQYLRVLGFKKESASLLKAIETHATLPMVMNLKHAHHFLNPLAMSQLHKEIETTDTYYLATSRRHLKPQAKHAEYSKPLVII